jgi:hypothetical protein
MLDLTLSHYAADFDDTSPPSELANDACTQAENIEFVNSTLGERRSGCTAIALPASVTADADLDAVTWMYRHLEVNDEDNAQLWLLAQSLDAADNILVRRKLTAWETITQNDPITSTFERGHRLSAQTLHGKLFIAHKSTGIDRLHVWDGTTLRRAGLAAPGAAPTGADTGSGTFSGVRYYRVRFTVQAAGVTLRRSEPSAVLTFTPSGTGLAAQITKPATISENETHWELEASLDNANFYRITTELVATTTYDDSVAFGIGYATTGTLSEDIEDYSLIPSGKFLSADEDRLIIAGSWEDSAQASRVRWTPVFAAPGVGNDERIELDTDPFLDLDGFEGGEITGLSRATNGYLYAFKRSHIYRLVRTGRREQAYEAIALTKARGALPGSLVEAINQAGLPSQYFLDPSVGPTRISSNGIQWVGRDIQTFWRTVNINAKIPCHGIYYSDKRQVHYWLAVGTSEYPNAKLVLHVNETRDTDEGARRGWVTVGTNDRIATAHSSTTFSTNIDTTDARSFPLVPFIGKERWTVGATPITDYVQQCDTGNKDADTTGDTGSTYYASVTTKPFIFTGLLNHLRVLAAALLLKASTDPDELIFVKAIRDFGSEERKVDTDLLALYGEEHSVKLLDDLNFSEIYALQIQFGDLDTNVTPPAGWELNQFQMKLTPGQRG